MATHFVTDEQMLLHKCEWDGDHIETPLRLNSILTTLKDSGILSQCKVIPSKQCSIEDLELGRELNEFHSRSYIEEIRQISCEKDLNQQEHYCSSKEDIYINAHSWDSSLLAAGCAVEALNSVLNKPGHNAFAAIRPPGHHASYDTPCGFCLFNNVALCAKMARSKGINRVLIIDWDVHVYQIFLKKSSCIQAGQGTQYCIDDDPGILLISIHRFENGHFWPELPESAISHKYSNTINIPLNHLGYGDSEYAAFMNLLVVPVIFEWMPELILVSCGFDAALGDPQGEMELSPIGFGYMTGVIASLNIPLCLLLEGFFCLSFFKYLFESCRGYFIESVRECSYYTIKALIEKATFQHQFNKPSPTFLTSLFSSILSKAESFFILKSCVDVINSLRARYDLAEIEAPSNEYKGNRVVSLPYVTRGLYPPRDPSVEKFYSKKLQSILNNDATVQAKNLNLLIDFTSFAVEGHNFPKLTLASASEFYFFYFFIAAQLSTCYRVTLNNEPVPSDNFLQIKNWGHKFERGFCESSSSGFVEKIIPLISHYELCFKPLFLFINNQRF